MATLAIDTLGLEALIDLKTQIASALVVIRARETASVKQQIDAILENSGMSPHDLASLYGLRLARGAPSERRR